MVNFTHMRSGKKFKLSTYDLEHKLDELLITLKKPQWPIHLRFGWEVLYRLLFFHPLTLHYYFVFIIST